MKKANIKRKVERSIKKNKDPNRITEKSKVNVQTLEKTKLKKHIELFKINESKINSYISGKTKELPSNLAKAGIVYYLLKLKNIQNPVRHHELTNNKELSKTIQEYSNNIRKLEELI